MKKLALVLVSLIVFVLGCVIAIPFFVDVDQYRPQVEAKLNEKIQGKVTIGKMGLSLWGTVRVSIAGVKMTDAKGKTLLSVADAEFVLPWSSVFQASPEAVFRMNRPELEAIQDESGKINWIETLVAQAPQTPTAAGQTVLAQKNATPAALPAVVTGASLSIELLDAKLVYQDLKAKPPSKVQVSDLDIHLKNASLTRPMDLEVQAKIASAQAEGDLKLKARVEPQGIATSSMLVKLGWDLDASQLKIHQPGAFLKDKGVALTSSGKIQATETLVTIESADFKLLSAVFAAQGKVHLEPAGPKLDLIVKSNPIELKSMSKLIPSSPGQAAMDLDGKIQLEAKLSGPSSALAYSGKLTLDSLSANSDSLKKVWKKPLEMDGSVSFANDRLDPIQLKMTAPGSALQVRGSLRGFLKPDLQLAVTSSGIDLDQWLIQPEKTKAAAVASSPGKTAATPSAADLDAPVAGLKNNAILKGAVGNWVVDIAKIKVSQVELTDFAIRSGLKNLDFSVQSFGFKIFDGNFQGSAQVSVATGKPTYRFSSKWNGLDLKKAVSSQMETFKHTVVGIFSGQAEGSGSSFNKDAAIKNFDLKGKFEAKAARFTSLDVTKMAFDALSKGIDAVGEKIPPLKGKKLNPLASRETRYEKISADFSMKNGQFSMPNFYAKADPGMGLDVQGATTLGILDESLNADWELIDVHNVTKAADLNAEVSGVQIKGILTDKGKLRLPVHVGCKMSSPCPDYAKTPIFLVKQALENAKGAATGHLKNTVQKAAQKEVEKKLIQGLGKKLFGR